MDGPPEHRGQDGFVNVNLPSELDLCIDALITNSAAGTLKFSKKKLVWQAAIDYWLKTRPDRQAGVAYLATQATKSKTGATGFVQRRVELGIGLERRVRELSVALADGKGRPFPLARIIYTALDYYVRQIAMSASPSNVVEQDPQSLENPAPIVSESSITFQMNVSRMDTNNIIKFVEILAPGPVSILLTFIAEKTVVRKLLDNMIGPNDVSDGLLISELTKHLARLGEGE